MNSFPCNCASWSHRLNTAHQDPLALPLDKHDSYRARRSHHSVLKRLFLFGLRPGPTQQEWGQGLDLPEISERPRYFGVLPLHEIPAGESKITQQGHYGRTDVGAETESLAGAVVDKLISSSHGS
jgi:hypothetical protein